MTLYNTDILRLAASIPYEDRLAAPMASVEKRSPVCGSRVTVDIEADDEGRVSALGLSVRACALGQASTALMRQHAIGRTPAELAEARDQLTGWLAGEREELPEWPGFALLIGALPHRGRHASIRLAFEAAAEAAAIAAGVAHA